MLCCMPQTLAMNGGCAALMAWRQSSSSPYGAICLLGAVGTFSCCRGKHHSKFFLLQYETGLRFILLTANLHHPDCCNKSQVSLRLGLPAVQQIYRAARMRDRCGFLEARCRVAEGSPELMQLFWLQGLYFQDFPHKVTSNPKAGSAARCLLSWRQLLRVVPACFCNLAALHCSPDAPSMASGHHLPLHKLREVVSMFVVCRTQSHLPPQTSSSSW